MKKIKFLLVLILVSTMTVFINSCTKDESLHGIESSAKIIHKRTNDNLQLRAARQGNSNELFTVLGRKRNNPYTITNMTLAFNALYGTNYSALPKTHNYVKFSPTITEHLAYIEEWETENQIAVFDFPLEYEIITTGEKYIDPSISDSIYSYRYASIPIEIEFPNVPYQILEELFIPPINSYIAETAFYLVGEEYEGRTTKHPEWSDPPDVDDCTPECDNYPCCLFGWFDCGGYECGDPVLPCIPGDPDWPECLDIYPPIDPPVDPPTEPEFCYCTEYEFGSAVYGWVVELKEGETCEDLEYGSSNEFYVECETYNPPPPPPDENNQCGCTIPNNERHPSGCVMVQNDGGLFIPVQMASIKVKDTWFTSDIVYTTDNGCWAVNKPYSGNVWMWVRFKNPNVKVRSTHFWLGMQVVRDYVGKFTAPPYNNILVEYSNVVSPTQANNRMYWASAHTLNTVNEYRNRAAVEGVPLPRTGLNITIQTGEGAASAPMLQNNYFNSWLAFLMLYINPYAYSQPLLPDITNRYTEIETAQIFTGSLNHELGHASHYSIVGETFWFGYRNHIINNFISFNGMYGSFGDFAWIGSDPEKVAISEALGNYMGHIYGSTLDGGENREWDNGDNFIPQGLMFDLVDDSPTDIVTDPNDATITGVDNISGFTRTMIWNAINPDIDEVRKFRDRLRVLHLSETPNNATDYNTFVDIYDVFNN